MYIHFVLILNAFGFGVLKYYPFDIKNDRFVAPYTELLEFDGETAKLYTCFTEEKGSTEYKECNIWVLRRVSNRTDYIKYRELNE